MTKLIVVSELEDSPLIGSEYEVTTAQEYLTNPRFSGENDRVRVINLCRSVRYQDAGYYVSLLATARGHKPLPSLATIQELKSASIARIVGDELFDLLGEALKGEQRRQVVLEAFFGRDPTGRFDRLAAAIYRRFPAPLLRILFTRSARRGRWALASCSVLSPRAIADEHRAFLASVAEAELARKPKPQKRKSAAYDLAILRDANEEEAPSNEEALRRFAKAAEACGMSPEFIDKSDYGRLPQFDALFIRETTSVTHRTYRFAQRAMAEGLVVIDDPESILRCTNKVFLAEMLARYEVPTPRTLVVHRGNADEVVRKLGLPCILKQPDSSFSQGVVKVATPEEYQQEVRRLLRRSELIVAQAFTPTEFDWRLGVLNRQPIYACKYYMAASHWQIIKRGTRPQENAEGPSEAVMLSEVPQAVVTASIRAANLMGDGLYGVDLKEINGLPYVIEVNDNPSIDAGSEDIALGQELYMIVMREFRRRLDARRGIPRTT